jgi:hypothetical protein
MEMVKVVSSNVQEIGWENNILYVQYNSGLYAYADVDQKLYEDLLKAESKGRFLAENVRGIKNYKRIK